MQSSVVVQPMAPSVALSDRTIALLSHVSVLASLDQTTLHCLDNSTERRLKGEEILVRQGETARFFWILLSGSLQVWMADANGIEHQYYTMPVGHSFGEVPLLANMPSSATVRAAMDSELLELNEDQFWQLMTACPEVRKAILGNMAARLAKMQSTTFQQEKMASLGTLAAGLMHELNNPGSAARRASTQLRQNMMRMHELTESWAKLDLSPVQKKCMYDIQELALRNKLPRTLSTIEQSDAEETLSEWLEEAEVNEAWKLAPTLVSVGIRPEHLACARSTFDTQTLSNTLSWMEAMVSNMQLVGTIEESISRVTDLIHAVKSYAYEGRGTKQTIDLNDSIYATLVILGHKIREKELTLNKDFGVGLPLLQTECQGLNQVWTNLLDNAIDAAPQKGALTIRTWSDQNGGNLNEPAQPNAGKSNPGKLESGKPGPAQPGTDLCILIGDNGPGIPAEIQPHIFDPFYTTKPVGVGTGMGLGIVHRIVEQYGGRIHFTSAPGDTEFVVRIPVRT